MPDYIVIRITKEQAMSLVAALHTTDCHNIKDTIVKAIKEQKSPMKERLIQNDKKK